MMKKIQIMRLLTLIACCSIIFFSCRQEYLPDTPQTPESCDIVGKWVLCFDKPFDYDLELCDDPEYVKSLPVWDFRADGSLVIGGITGYKYTLNCPTINISAPGEPLGIESTIVSLELNEMIWDDNFFCSGQCVFVRYDPIPETKDTSMLVECPDGIEVDCQTGIIGRWHWINTYKQPYFDKWEASDISFRPNDAFGAGLGLPGGKQYSISSNCEISIRDEFGNIIRNVEIVALDENILVLNDPTYPRAENLVFLKYFDEVNFFDDNTALLSKIYCDNQDCSDCTYGLCNCPTQYNGSNCQNQIETFHIINREIFKDSEVLPNGDLLIVSMEQYKDQNQAAIYRVNPASNNILWQHVFDLDMETPLLNYPDNEVIFLLDNSDIIIAGRYKADNDHFLRLIRLTTDGEVIWIKDDPVNITIKDPTSIKRYGNNQIAVIYDYAEEDSPYTGRIYNLDGDFITEVYFYGAKADEVPDPFSAHLTRPFMVEMPSNGIDYIYQDIFGDCCTYAERNNTGGDVIFLKEIDFFSTHMETFGAPFTLSPRLLKVERFGDKMLFLFNDVNFDYLFLDRIDADQAIVVTDLDYNVESIVKVPNYFSINNDAFGWTLNQQGEVLLAQINSDDNPIVAKFNSEGIVDFVYEMTFDQYSLDNIFKVHRISADQYALLGSGKRFGEDVFVIKFDVNSVPRLYNICQ